MMKKAQLAIGAAVLLGVGYVATFAVARQQKPDAPSKTSAFSESTDGWEYLVLSGLTTNLASSDSDSMRKNERSPVGREQYVVERNLDKLGHDGWELVTVAGPPNDPIYYLKRRK